MAATTFLDAVPNSLDEPSAVSALVSLPACAIDDQDYDANCWRPEMSSTKRLGSGSAISR